MWSYLEHLECASPHRALLGKKVLFVSGARPPSPSSSQVNVTVPFHRQKGSSRPAASQCQSKGCSLESQPARSSPQHLFLSEQHPPCVRAAP